MFLICHYLNYFLYKKNLVVFGDLQISGKDIKESDLLSHFKLFDNFNNRNLC